LPTVARHRRGGINQSPRGFDKLTPVKVIAAAADHPTGLSLPGGHMTSALHIVCPHCDSVNRVPRERLRDRAKCGTCHRPLYEGRPAALDNAARFDKHARHSDIPLLVDFWAAWCGPCRAMAPVFEQAAAELEPEVRLIKVDSDAVPELLQRYGIQSIPTLMLVHHGREIARQSGTMPLPRLLAWTREHAEGVKV
jgi:thioredoxin 2